VFQELSLTSQLVWMKRAYTCRAMFPSSVIVGVLIQASPLFCPLYVAFLLHFTTLGRSGWDAGQVAAMVGAALWLPGIP
jgi:hypothetical protein